MRNGSEWVYGPGDLAEGGWESVVDARIPGWQHTGLRVAELDGSADSGATVALAAGDVERMIVPLAGSFTVEYDEQGAATASQVLVGRASVFDGPTDVLYLGAGTSATIGGHGRVAVTEAVTAERRPAAYLPASAVPVELRGGGQSSRQVHNFGVPGALDAVKLIACEVITPAGNWSSYPPHKHDEHRPGVESRLEEIYYFETAVTRGAEAPAEAAPFAVFATYSSDERPIAIDARVGSGDIALVPHGYHGPAVAAPGYDLYYLNVMAGPDAERSWLITDDPAHGWVRRTWDADGMDARLPYASTGSAASTGAPASTDTTASTEGAPL
ncbi:5-deoxy-glucuronate isomerase [Leifsonia sp. Root227]|uniref:5-deoxy-glucuronate isomerase n=1 Tax=Leifsonia sp. Root227 TaxID=1736496 RepID=UPI0006FAEFF8|nr:5-deoxy-glucuronate isomerase [Leifsonia sp. Root227]KRC49655.1 5-deoxy-glucuronate isomerase [Leifsonia sp. Root227]